jgi:hypothetical protein
MTHKINNWSLRYNYSDDWLRNIQKKQNSITLTMISNWWYDETEYDAPPKIVINKRCKHTLTDHWDNTYTLYMDQDWQPIYFYL